MQPMTGSVEGVITAIGTACAAVAGGAAALIAAWAKREATRAKDEAAVTKDQTATGNGSTLGTTVARIQSELAEQRPLLEWARLRRASELTGIHSPSVEEVHFAEELLHGSIDDSPKGEVAE